MLPKAYEPSQTEDNIYAMWEESGAFKPDEDTEKETFTISMPPPNATGQLHLGHAVMLALEDIFTRYQRMQGKAALWVPGTDHAAIATESVVIKRLQAEGIKDPRKEFGREGLIEKIHDFCEDSKNTIRSQVRKMGSSCDWSREGYTMEPALNRCVNEAFTRMYNDELVYRGHRTVNWDPKLQTTLSDDEVVYKEQRDPFYWFTYGPFTIGTVRPETKFGDKYVVVHPDDERYKDYEHGQTFECEWINGTITATVIKDKAADPEFGTGAMTITPWHSLVDFEIAQRHNLDYEQIIDFDGKLLDCAGEFAGMKIEDARPKLVEKLEAKGLVIKVEDDYVHNVATSSRGGGIVEPQVKQQWFIDVNKEVVPWKGGNRSLKQILQDVVREGDISLIPNRFDKTYFSWIDNLRDWCISRQIWWGHRVPVWYKDGETYAGLCAPDGDGWEQDTDTLDTWFSSALWTWSTLVDKEKAVDPSLRFEDLLKQSPDFQRFHPTQVMETGYDILFFWVARMILMTTYMIGEIPFDTVYLHGLIRTRDGKKMSKSDPSTCIDPLEVIPKYGADALRLSMIVGQAPGNDSRLYDEKIAGYRNFMNKLWNASRFVLMTCEEKGVDPKQVLGASGEGLSLADRAILSQLQSLIDDCTAGLAEYRLSEVGERIYSFVWDVFCDWHLELSKGEASPEVLVHTVRQILILLHPYCPFITEELWSHFAPQDAEILMKTSWPEADGSLRDTEAEENLQRVIDTITNLRRLRAEQGIEPGKKLNAIIHSVEFAELLASQKHHIERMAKLEELAVDSTPASHDNAASAFLEGIEIHIPLEGLIDLGALTESLTKERDDLTAYIGKIEKKLSNEKFVANADPAVVESEREKLRVAEEKLTKVEERLATL